MGVESLRPWWPDSPNRVSEEPGAIQLAVGPLLDQRSMPLEREDFAMQPFEVLMILVSIIVGLGITQLLAGVVRLMRGELEGYWIHWVWVLNVFLLLLQYCWSLFDLEAQSDWVFLQLMQRLTPPILLYLAASLLFPARNEDSSMVSFYIEKRKPVFGLLVLLTIFYAVQGWSARDRRDVIRLIALGIYALLFVTERRAVHAVLSLIITATIVLFIGLFSYELGGSH